MAMFLERIRQWRAARRMERTRSSVFRTLSRLEASENSCTLYNDYKRSYPEHVLKQVTETELEHLNRRIDKLLAKIDDGDCDISQTDTEEECVVCLSAKATMQTYPCSHKVVCRKCFIKTIQMAVSQRCLPLRCVVCRSRILKLRQFSETKSKRRSEPTKKKFFSRVRLNKPK